MSFPGSPANRVGICSWSLRSGSSGELAQRVRKLALGHVQLALDPIREHRDGWGEVETLNALRRAGIVAVSGMMAMIGEDYSTLETIKLTGGVREDAAWDENLRACEGNARLARRLNIPLVTFHAGFIPHERGRGRDTMIDRLRMLTDRFDDHGIRVAFETGQETADTLVDALDELDRPHAGINFDPANMILYGMGDPPPAAALARLAHRVVQVHIKDATPTSTPGTWGTEVRAGSGAVDWKAFVKAFRAAGLAADLVIERESGENRDADIAAAVELLARHGYGSSVSGGGPWHE